MKKLLSLIICLMTFTGIVFSQTVPREYYNALQSAYVYSSEMHMSKQAVYEQLCSPFGEKFTKDAAKYAIEHVRANWRENAAKSAKVYYYEMHMSRQAVYEQLCSPYGDKFTKDEALYAIEQL